MTRAWRATVAISALVAALVFGWDGADGDELAERARRSFVQVRVWDITKPTARTHVVAGSGVLITREGHILTAWHVAEFAVDKPESLNDDVVPHRDRAIEVTFAKSDRELEPRQYAAEVIGYLPEADLALLRIDLTTEDAIARRRAPIDYGSAQTDCRGQCFRVLGVVGVKMPPNDEEEWRVEYEEAAPARELGNDHRRQLTSNFTHGYSGGPVFFKEKSPWPLVGIALSGMALRQLTTYMVSVHAVDPLVNPLRERLDVVNRERFPSARFLARTGITHLSEKDIAAVVQRIADPVRLANLLLAEDFEASSRQALEMGKKLLDAAASGLSARGGPFFVSWWIPFATRQPPAASNLRRVPILHAALTEKLVVVSRRLEEDGAAQARRAEANGSVYRRHCASLRSIGASEAELSRCWHRADARFRQIWAWDLRPARDRFGAEIEAGRSAMVVSTAFVIVDHFLTWGEMLSEAATHSSSAALKLGPDRFGPLQPIPGSSRPSPDKLDEVMYRNAALDRFLFAQGLLAFIVQETSLGTAYRVEDHNRRLQRWCEAMLQEVQKLRSLHDRGKPYDLDLERRQADARKQCSR